MMQKKKQKKKDNSCQNNTVPSQVDNIGPYSLALRCLDDAVLDHCVLLRARGVLSWDVGDEQVTAEQIVAFAVNGNRICTGSVSVLCDTQQCRKQRRQIN